MKCFKVIEELQNLILNGSKIPLSNKVVVKQEQVLNLLDELVREMPEDLKDAEKIIKERQKILIDAQQEGELIIKEARATIEKMVDQEEIIKLAKDKSDQILAFAKQTARELRAGANAYADEILEEAQKHLEKLLETLKQSREELKQSR